MMRRAPKLVSLLVAALVTLLVGVTVYAVPPTQGGGTFFDVVVTPIEDDQIVGSNTISELLLTATIDGPLEGVVTAEITCVVKTRTGRGICHARATFEGLVEGAEGALELKAVFKVDGPDLKAGSFTVISGTDELAGFHGVGKFSGSFATASGIYTMKFHFDP